MRKRKHTKTNGMQRTPKINQSIFDGLKTPQMLKDEARVARQNEQYRQDKRRREHAEKMPGLLKHPPTRELQVTPSEPKTAVEWLLALPDRMNAMLTASREPDAAKRNRLFKFIASAKMLVVTIVPFVKRPRTFGELVLVQKVTKLIRAMNDRTKRQP